MMIEFLPLLFQGTLVTIEVTSCAVVLGLSLGLLAAIGESAKNTWIAATTRTLTLLLRGLPELLTLFFVYFGISMLLTRFTGYYIEINAFVAGVIAFGVIFAAYASQVFRGAFRAIPQAGREAAEAMGFHRLYILRRIILPQAWRHALPGLGNLWLVLLKDSALVSLIGLADLMGRSLVLAENTQLFFNFYLIAALIYLSLTGVSQFVIRRLMIRSSRFLEANHD